MSGLRAAVLTGVIAMASGSLLPATASAATVTVSTGPRGNEPRFVPRTVTVRPGDSVNWVWGSSPHSVTSGQNAFDGAFDSAVYDAPFTYTVPFAARGWYPYFCRIHRAAEMTGSVLVAASTPPTASFVAAPATAEVGQTVTFDASASGDADPGDAVASYRWDLDGNGSFEAASSSPVTSRSYASPGLLAVRLQVVDRQGDVGEPVVRSVLVQDPRAPVDHIPPVLGALRVRPASFCTRRSPGCRTPGTRIRLTLSEAARVAGQVSRSGRGRRSARGRALAFRGRPGANVFRYRGAGLRPGNYRLTLAATDAAGNRSRPLTARFAVRR